MPESSAFPAAEGSRHRLHRSGRSCGETALAGNSGRTVWLVDGSSGENKLGVDGTTPSEAWWRAVEVAGAVVLSGGSHGPASGGREVVARRRAFLLHVCH